jgi:hypothetical protein
MEKCFHKVNETSVNTGTYIGYCGYLKQFLQMLSWFSNDFAEGENDQEVASRIWKQFPEMISIDKRYDFFVTLYGGSSFLPDNQISWSYWPHIQMPADDLTVSLCDGTQARPCVLHGPCNTNLNDILIKLGYQIPDSVKRYTTLHHIKYMLKAFHSYTPFIILWLVLWVIVIFSSMYCSWSFARWAKQHYLQNDVLNKTNKTQNEKNQTQHAFF